MAITMEDISLEVPQGGIVTLLGANGAGKSTTLKTISGLLRPSAGSIEFDKDFEPGGHPAGIIPAVVESSGLR